jgi:hypothetical protein
LWDADDAAGAGQGMSNQRVNVNWPLFMAPPHDWPIMPPDIIPDMLPEYVPVMVCPSVDMVAWPSTPMEHDDIMPPNPPVGTVMWNVMVDPLTVPCIEPVPIKLRPVSPMFIVPVMAVPFWVTVQASVSGPVVSADVPVQVPDTLVRVPGEAAEGVAGVYVLPPQAVTASKPKTTNIDLRIRRSRSVMTQGCRGGFSHSLL